MLFLWIKYWVCVCVCGMYASECLYFRDSMCLKKNSLQLYSNFRDLSLVHTSFFVFRTTQQAAQIRLTAQVGATVLIDVSTAICLLSCGCHCPRTLIGSRSADFIWSCPFRRPASVRPAAIHSGRMSVMWVSTEPADAAKHSARVY